jgi:hypothetical protein
LLQMRLDWSLIELDETVMRRERWAGPPLNAAPDKQTDSNSLVSAVFSHRMDAQDVRH